MIKAAVFHFIIINYLTARVVGAPQVILQPVFSIFPVLHCPLGLSELQACPFPDTVFPPLPLYALSSSPFHCAPALSLPGTIPSSGELRTQKLKSCLVTTQSLNVIPLKPGVGQCIAIHATLTARDFFLVYFYPSGPFTCIFAETSPDFSCVGCG